MNRRTVWFVIAVLASVWMAEILYAEEKTVGVIWSGKSGRCERMLVAFQDEMRRMAPDVRLIIDKGIFSMEEAEKRFRAFESTMDGIVFMRSSGAKFLGRANPRIPCFFAGCNNPIELGAVKSLHAPEGNVTGETYFIPYERSFDIIQQIFPHAKRIGFLGEEGHSGTPIEQREISMECGRRKLEYHEAIAKRPKDLLNKTKTLAPKVDLILLGNESLVFDNVIDLVAIANATRTPLFGFLERVVKRGAVAGLVTNDEQQGVLLAESVVAVVVKGTPVNRVPVKTCPLPRILIHRSMMEQLGVRVPASLISRTTWID